MTIQSFVRTIVASVAVFCFLMTVVNPEVVVGQSLITTTVGVTEEVSQVGPLSPAKGIKGDNISLTLEDVSLEKAIRALDDRTDYRFSYSSESLPTDRRVSLHLEDISSTQALDRFSKEAGIVFEVTESGHVIPVEFAKVQEIVVQDYPVMHMVSGVVTTAEDGNPLPGANVTVKGTSIGTSTDRDGHYSIEAPSPTDTLVFSFVGYVSQEVPIDNREEVDVALEQETTTLEQLIVVGYSEVEREELTSAVTRVSSDEFIQGAVNDPAELIRGQVPGLSINKVGANPTENSTLMLRGTGTLIGDASPLVIIDGVEGSLSDVSPQDIESVNVIKDASAAAIYGTRGSNGVVIIETSRAGEERVSFGYEGYVSTQQVTSKIPVLTAEEYRNVDIDGIETVDFGASNDWQELVYRDAPVSHEHNLSMSGSMDDTRYVASLSYKRSEGLVNRSDNNEVRGRLRVDHSMFDGLLGLTGNMILSNKWHFQGSEGGSFNNRVINNITAFNPTRPIYNEDGSYNDSGDNNHENPVSIIEEVNGELRETRANFFGTAEMSPIEGLDLKLQGSHFTTDVLEGYAQTNNHVIDIRNGTNGYASRSTNKNTESILETTAEYENRYGDNTYNVLGGFTWKEEKYESFFANNWDFPTDAVAYNNLSDGAALSDGETTSDSYKQKSNLVGFFARANWSYDNRYMLTASMRREASSKFGAENKWGNFPSFSLGWNVANESFMSGFEDINQLKVRFGFGRTGTSPTDPYLSLSRLSFDERFLSNGDWVSTLQPLNNPNPNLRWETREEYNLGFDVTLFEERIDGSVDLYRRETRDLLFNFTVPTPPFLYSTMLANAGTMENRGLEVAVSTFPVRGDDFVWNSSINYSTNRNELTSLSSEDFTIGEGGFFDAGYTGAPIQQQTHRVQVGEQVGNFYGYKTIGVTDDGMWLIEGADGEPKSIEDQVPEDKQFIGNGVPEHQVSWSNFLSFKDWDLSVTMRGAFGFQVANMRGMFFGVPQVLRQMNALRSSLDEKYGQRPLSADQPEQYVSHFIEDGDFWKIDNVTLGYNFSIGSILREGRVYVSGNNLITITGYNGFDPEVEFSGLTPGIDHIFRFPSARNYTMGVRFAF